MTHVLDTGAGQQDEGRMSAIRTLPSAERTVAVVTGAIIVFALLRSLLAWTPAPLGLPLAAAVASVVSLAAIAGRSDPTTGFMRAGFHLGTLAFFLAFPLLVPDFERDIAPSAKTTIGWALLLSVVSFEIAYWLRRRPDTWPNATSPTPILEARNVKTLRALVAIGLVLVLLPLFDEARAGGLSLQERVLLMRAPVEEVDAGDVTLDGGLVLVKRLLSGGGVLSASAAAVLLMSGVRIGWAMRIGCWTAMLGCAFLGFTSGTRTVFLYSLMPFLVSLVARREQTGRRQSRPWLPTVAWGLVVVVCLSLMSEVRDAGLHEGEADLSGISPVEQAAGTFNIYAELPTVVQGFPDVFPYQHGRSLVPLALGWIPRAFWPDKPYPFSSLVTYLRGESLEVRTASIATGLVGEGYGNFGLLGVVLWSGLLGLAARRSDDLLGSLPPGFPLRLVLGAMSGILAAMIVRGGVSEMFYMALGQMALPGMLAWYLLRVSAKTPRPMPVIPLEHAPDAAAEMTRRTA